METGNLTQKELKDTELVDLHRKLYLTYIKEKITNLRNKRIATRYYDAMINKDNIRLYYNRHIHVFTEALLTQRLESIVKHNSFQ